MDWRSLLDARPGEARPGEARPVVVALAGSNGAGKSTFFHAHLADAGLRFVNADDLAAEMDLGAYEAADLAAAIRASLIEQGESFVFETVLSDPAGAKVAELEEARRQGADVVLIFIRIDSSETSKQRVSMRVAQGGHDVPDEKLETRFDRTLANLERAIRSLRLVVILDNNDLNRPYRLEAIYQNGERVYL